MKKLLNRKTAFAVILIVLIALFVLYQIHCYNDVIGTSENKQNDLIVIGDTVYAANPDLPFTEADKGEFLGFIRAGGMRWRVFSIKGDEEGKYLYSLWDFAGNLYERVDE